MVRSLGGYKLVRELGRGASAVVFAVEDEAGYPHALKLLHPIVAEDEGARERIRREAEAINSIKGEGIARVHDFEIDGVEPFIVTDLVSGSTLAEMVSARGPMSLPQVIRFGRKIARILDNVHAAGVTHRDVKPGNIILSPEGPVLVDFGIAQAEDAERLTATGLLTGTAGYVPAQLLQGQEPNQIADWWAWVATLLFTATGHPPFGSGSQATILTRVMAGQVDTSGLDRAAGEVFAKTLRMPLEELPAWQDFLADLEDSTQVLPESESLTRSLPVEPEVFDTRPLPVEPEVFDTRPLPVEPEIPATRPLPVEPEIPATRPMPTEAPSLATFPSPTPDLEPAVTVNFEPPLLSALDSLTGLPEVKPLRLGLVRLALGIVWAVVFLSYPLPIILIFIFYGMLGNALGYVWQRTSQAKSRWRPLGIFRLLYAIIFGGVRAVVYTLVAGILSAGITLGGYAIFGYIDSSLPAAFEVPKLIFSASDWAQATVRVQLIVTVFIYVTYCLYWLSPSVHSHREFMSYQLGKLISRKRSRLVLNLVALLIVLGTAFLLYTLMVEDSLVNTMNMRS